jgi:hypothetical protein
MFGSMILRRIFRPGRDEETEGLRKLHNEEFPKLYSLPRIIRMVSQKVCDRQRM